MQLSMIKVRVNHKRRFYLRTVGPSEETTFHHASRGRGFRDESSRMRPLTPDAKKNIQTEIGVWVECNA